MTTAWPVIIQGGMGAAISTWRLAQAVASRGQLGVVSGVGLDTVLVRRLLSGDDQARTKEIMAGFPVPGAMDALFEYLERTRNRDDRTLFPPLPLYRYGADDHWRQQLLMLAAYVEVALAKDGHDGAIGINLLTKIHPPVLPTLYGAMLAGVDYVLMGAGIPREIPGCLDLLARHEPAEWRLEIAGPQPAEPVILRFDPAAHWSGPKPPLARPRFLAIVASNSLATVLVRKASGTVDGLVIEGWTAGGHNAPPRGALQLDARGEPVYGERDAVDLAKIRELGVPFYLAGGVGSPQRLREAREQGAAGIQVGTLFAYCDESGMAPRLKHSILEHARREEVRVRTDPRASPTGYPFKIVEWDDDPSRGVVRERICDLGYLREAFVRDDGRIGFRCSGEPLDDYLKKGGRAEDAEGRRCLCNGLLATAGYPQRRTDGLIEPPVVTSGDDLLNIGTFLDQRDRYSAGDVLEYLLNA